VADVLGLFTRQGFAGARRIGSFSAGAGLSVV
jgi:hypothetical protein